MKFDSIPFCRASIDDNEIQSVIEVLKSGWITTGKKTVEFEKMSAEYIKCDHAIALSSCTAALHLALLALDVGPGDEVITTPLTFASTVNTIIHTGATPIFADIDIKTGNIAPEEIEKKITSKTKVLLPVHYAGLPCPMDKIIALAKKYNLRVIEDSAHAIGSTYNGEKIGSKSDISCFSFYPTKTMTTIEGGLLTCNDPKIAEKVRNMSLHGLSKNAWSRYTQVGNWRYDVIFPGYKYNMSDVQSAIGVEQLKKLDYFIKRRRELASLYIKEFQNLSCLSFQPYSEDNSYHLFVIVLNQKSKIARDELIIELSKRNIGTAVNFIPIPMHSYYRENLGLNIKDFPNCEQFYNGAISLPLFPELTNEQALYVANTVKGLIT